MISATLGLPLTPFFVIGSFSLSEPNNAMMETGPEPTENARSFLENYLSEHVLRLLDLESLEVCKDSFV